MTADVQAPAALTERRGNVLVITLNRPEARNAVNSAVSIAVGDALQAAQDDPDVRAVVITGAGESFCAGADLKAISRRENLFHPDHGEWGFAGYVHHYIDKPTIAAVNGTALGGGTELALASDLVVAEERAKFGLPEVKRGLIAAAGGVFRIVDHLPRKVAMELLVHRRADEFGRRAASGVSSTRSCPTAPRSTRRSRSPSGSRAMRRLRYGRASGWPWASTTV